MVFGRGGGGEEEEEEEEEEGPLYAWPSKPKRACEG